MNAAKRREIKKLLVDLGRTDLAHKLPKYTEPWQYTQFINSKCKLSYVQKEKMIKILNKEETI